ncbi:MAG: sulfur carrier protein ThiS [Phycisphaera sp.]|nr:sulfur carrier protein ThiS [Phycisphaera sp.]
MKLTLNGDAYEMPGGEATVADLVRELGLEKQAVAVEVNKRLAPKREHATTTLNDGDVVEVVTLVGGG